MNMKLLAGAVAVSALAIGMATQVDAQKATGPKARYQMDVTTASGMPGLTGGGGAGGGAARPRGGLGAMFGGGGMSAMMGGGGPRREIDLRLGSTLSPSGAPAADHFMPAGVGLGPSVPLLTSLPNTMAERDTPQGRIPEAKGRILIFWGCGAKARPGQPVIIDFAKVAQGQMPTGLMSANIPVDRGPTTANSRTLGIWPNERGRRVEIPGNASLVGAHRVAGNYSPEIKYALNQDFMAPMRVQTTEMGNATNISWNAIPAATGYYAHAMGAAEAKRGQSMDIIWWTSADRREFFGGLTDWLSPSTVQRLIGERVVMPPTQTQCQMPAEIKAAGGENMILSLHAYGPEANFAFPPRPANTKLAWNPEWTARVRYRSVSSKIVGMPDMDEAMADDDGDRRGGRDRPPAKKCGMLQRAAGLC